MKLIIDVPLTGTDVEAIQAAVEQQMTAAVKKGRPGEQPRVVRLVWIEAKERARLRSAPVTSADEFTEPHGNGRDCRSEGRGRQPHGALPHPAAAAGPRPQIPTSQVNPDGEFSLSSA